MATRQTTKNPAKKSAAKASKKAPTKSTRRPSRRPAEERLFLERWLVEQLMFGSGRIRRFTQDSPVLPDVWFEYALDPEILHRRLTRVTAEEDLHPPVNLLLTPFREVPAGVIRKEVSRRVTKERKRPEWKRYGHDGGAAPRIIYNQSTAAATLYFEDLVRAVIPMSDWWRKLTQKFDPALLQREDIQSELAKAVRDPEHPARSSSIPKLPPDVLWLIRVVGAIALVHRGERLPEVFRDEKRGPGKATAEEWLPLVRAVAELMENVEAQDESARIYSVALNRIASPTIFGSRRAVKADAAERVFRVSCKEIRWAIIDSGIDATHTAFRERDKDGKPVNAAAAEPFDGYRSRVKKTYDFSQIHNLLDPDAAEQRAHVRKLAKGMKANVEELTERVQALNKALSLGSSIDWGLIEPLLEIAHDADYRIPSIDHGTHVAGIIGAGEWPQGEGEDPLLGICPDIQLYDLRILDESGEGDEFTVMAALQFVRWLNSTNDYVAIHGVNLSLSIPHDVANYACGRTPVCDEAERVVSTGVVVVAAAGNLGYRKYSTPDGQSEAYNTISITDPGNAQNVITVGATHRGRPHTYGVSYFSSRGPTGDGRHKPDLVAPGEKITSVLPGESAGVKDGTSMAAPHVSGAAAMLMARHDELIGDPARIKEVLCSTATDLGRERYFQGAGMLDILRALQSV